MKKQIFIFLLIVLVSIFSGCNFNKIDIYDNNEKIVDQGDTYSYLHRSMQKDDNKVTMQFQNFYGSETLWTLNDDTYTSISVTYDVTIESGRFKIVVINDDNQIINTKEGSSSGVYDIALSNGKTRIKIVGYEAKGNFTYQITKNA